MGRGSSDPWLLAMKLLSLISHQSGRRKERVCSGVFSWAGDRWLAQVPTCVQFSANTRHWAYSPHITDYIICVLPQLVTGGTGARTQMHFTPKSKKASCPPTPSHCFPELEGQGGCLGVWVEVAEMLEAGAVRETGESPPENRVPLLFTVTKLTWLVLCSCFQRVLYMVTHPDPWGRTQNYISIKRSGAAGAAGLLNHVLSSLKPANEASYPRLFCREVVIVRLHRPSSSFVAIYNQFSAACGFFLSRPWIW